MRWRPAYLTLFILFPASILALAACAPAPTVPPFIPPAAPSIPTSTHVWTPSPSPIAATAVPSTLVPPSPAASASPGSTTEPCTNGLNFIQDLTVPDGTIIPPAGSIEKKWLVENSGSCDWDSSYRLKLTAGDSLGASAEQALYPARAGAQAVLSITFTAPFELGTYQSSWQAFGPNGSPFGDPVYMTIIVSP